MILLLLFHSQSCSPFSEHHKIEAWSTQTTWKKQQAAFCLEVLTQSIPDETRALSTQAIKPAQQTLMTPINGSLIKCFISSWNKLIYDLQIKLYPKVFLPGAVRPSLSCSGESNILVNTRMPLESWQTGTWNLPLNPHTKGEPIEIPGKRQMETIFHGLVFFAQMNHSINNTVKINPESILTEKYSCF